MGYHNIPTFSSKSAGIIIMANTVISVAGKMGAAEGCA